MIKIDIISGFLGAGKTTFANMLLRHYMDIGLRPVYIVNEFGQTGLDAEIIKADGFEAVELRGGCICCTLKNDIAGAILEVIDTFSPTNIIFEPSGIFIFDNFFEILKQPDIQARCELGCVLTVVDSVNFSFSKTIYGSFIYNQIQTAPVILLSKIEKAEHDIDETICDIKNISPEALVISKPWDNWGTADFEDLQSSARRAPTNCHAHAHSRLSSVTARLTRSFTESEFKRLIACCTSGEFGALCRVKGILKTENHRVLLNIAMQDVSIAEWRGVAEPTLTFIGQTINKKEISRVLNTYDA